MGEIQRVTEQASSVLSSSCLLPFRLSPPSSLGVVGVPRSRREVLEIQTTVTFQ